MLGAPRKLWIYVTDWALGVIPHPSIAAPEGWPKQETDPLWAVFFGYAAAKISVMHYTVILPLSFVIDMVLGYHTREKLGAVSGESCG